MKSILYIGSDCCKDFLARLEKESKWHLAVAKTGTAGIQDARKPFDLIVASVCIPDISSWEVLQRLKTISSSPIVLLGNIPVSKERIKSLKEEGFKDYLLDLRGNKLFSEVKKLLS